MTGQHGRIEAAREVTQLFERCRDFPAYAGQPVLGDGIGQLGGDHGQLELQGHQALLGAVVQVALEPLAFEPAGLDDPAELAAQFGLQAAVFERERGRGGDGVEEFPLVVE